MIQFFLRWLASAAALYITVLIGHALGLRLWLAGGMKGVIAAIIAAALLGVVNAVIRPILTLLTLPITCMTLGLFSFVINASLFWLVGFVVPGFNVVGFIAALFGSVVMTIVGGLLNLVIVEPVSKHRAEAD